MQEQGINCGPSTTKLLNKKVQTGADIEYEGRGDTVTKAKIKAESREEQDSVLRPQHHQTAR